MILHRDGWRYSGRVPNFFPGSCGNCCASGYHIRQYTNDSSMTVIGEQRDNRTARGLWFDGTTLTAVYTAASSPQVRAIAYNASLATVRTVTHSYNADGTSNPEAMQSVHPCSDGSYAMTATRTAAVSTRAATASVNSDDSLDWETSVDTYSPFTTSAICVVSDSSGNVYTACTNGDDAGKGYLFKYDNAGVKQWKTAIGSTTAGGGGFRPRQITIASDGFIWVSGNNNQIVRVNTSGTVSLTVTQSNFDDNIGSLHADQSGGIWVGVNNSTTYTIRNYNSSGSLVTTITEPLLALGGGRFSRFDVDSSDNVYGLLLDSSAAKVKKWNSSGTLQWTSGTVGWPGSTSTVGPHAIAVDSTYIFIAGAWVP